MSSTILLSRSPNESAQLEEGKQKKTSWIPITTLLGAYRKQEQSSQEELLSSIFSQRQFRPGTRLGCHRHHHLQELELLPREQLQALASEPAQEWAPERAQGQQEQVEEQQQVLVYPMM